MFKQNSKVESKQTLPKRKSSCKIDFFAYLNSLQISLMFLIKIFKKLSESHDFSNSGDLLTNLEMFILNIIVYFVIVKFMIIITNFSLFLSFEIFYLADKQSIRYSFI